MDWPFWSCSSSRERTSYPVQERKLPSFLPGGAFFCPPPAFPNVLDGPLVSGVTTAPFPKRPEERLWNAYQFGLQSSLPTTGDSPVSKTCPDLPNGWRSNHPGSFFKTRGITAGTGHRAATNHRRPGGPFRFALTAPRGLAQSVRITSARQMLPGRPLIAETGKKLCPAPWHVPPQGRVKRHPHAGCKPPAQ